MTQVPIHDPSAPTARVHHRSQAPRTPGELARGEGVPPLPAAVPPGPEAAVISGVRCPRCGGSGILRLDDQRYRTCLDCLGQGQLPVADGGSPLLAALSAGSSVSAAR